MQCDLIDRRRFVDACTLWASRKHTSLADLLVEQGWMTASDRQYVDDLLERRHSRKDESSNPSFDDSLTTDISLVGTLSADNLVGYPLAAGQERDVVDSRPAITIQDRITLSDLHSSGGIGEVWRAYDHVLERKIALKRLRKDKAHSDANRARFTREARLTGQLDHPGIVPVYDYHAGEQGIESFYTMRFLHGRTFTDVIREYHAQRPKDAAFEITGELLRLLDHFLAVCNTIAFAHSRHVIHRDLKGDNIIIGDFGEVVVLDWGLAKQIGGPAVGYEHMFSSADSLGDGEVQTLQGETLGTPSYMAPEQAQGRLDLIDYQTDVYGLAAILYEILTGGPPFQCRNLVELLRQVIEQPPRTPSEVVPGVPDELERICLVGLSKEMASRQPSVGALAGQVRAWITERAERRRVEQERERFFDLSLDFLAILERPDRISQSNNAWHDGLGWGESERAGRSFLAFVEDEYRDVAAAVLEQVWSGGGPASFQVRTAAGSGASHWVDWHARLIPGQSSIYLVGRDVTERRKAADECQELLESAPDATCVVDAEGTIVSVNTQLERLFGYTRTELVGQNVETLIPTAQRRHHQHHVARYVTNPGFRPMGVGLQLLGQKKNGNEVPLEISLGPVHIDNRLLVSCALRDTSERARVEYKLSRLFDAIPEALVVIDSDHRIDLINRMARELFGYSPSEVLGRPGAMLLPERHRAVYSDHLELAFERPDVVCEQSLSGACKDGTEFAVRLLSSRVETQDALLVCSAFHALAQDR